MKKVFFNFRLSSWCSYPFFTTTTMSRMGAPLLLMLATLAMTAVITYASIQSKPLALHSLVVVAPGASEVIKLRGFDVNGRNDKSKSQQGSYANLNAHITALTGSGAVHQLSDVYSKFGYEPIQGTIVTPPADRSAVGAAVKDGEMRVLYKRPTHDAEQLDKWGTIAFKVADGVFTSFEGTVTLVPPSGALVSSQFLMGDEGWTIVGNKAAMAPVHESSSRGKLNHFIYASDDKLNVEEQGGVDASPWYFAAPSKFLGNHGIAYGGSLDFVLSGFSGDLTVGNLNDAHAHVVVLECKICDYGRGVTLAYPLSSLPSIAAAVAQGAAASVADVDAHISLHESSGWLKDSKSSLVAWTTPSQCDMIQVLSNLSGMRILGDLTRWYETVGLDTVVIRNTRSRLPVCAQARPDALTCSC